jgi:hypothetical protein
MKSPTILTTHRLLLFRANVRGVPGATSVSAAHRPRLANGCYDGLTSLAEEPEAWLEREGQQHILQGSCSIGRAALNTLIVHSATVSRLHEIIHSQPSLFGNRV